MNDMHAAFRKWTVRRRVKGGYSIRCKKGLWAVVGPTKDGVELSAWRFFIHCFFCGKYNSEV